MAGSTSTTWDVLVVNPGTPVPDPTLTLLDTGGVLTLDVVDGLTLDRLPSSMDLDEQGGSLTLDPIDTMMEMS